MKWIRCLSLFFVLLMCFASTDVGAQTIKNRKFTIKNQNVLDAYCAYAYLLDEKDAQNTENLPGLYVEGWVQIPSGRAVTIEYASNFRVLYYCLILADGTKLEGKEKKTYSFSVPKDLIEDSFKVVHELNGGIIGAVRYTSVNEADLETQGFSREEYESTVLQLRIGIPGPVEIKTEDAVEIVEIAEFDGIKLQVLQEELEGLRQELAHSEAVRNALMEKTEHLEQIVKALENQLSVLQQHPDPKFDGVRNFDGVYDTRGFTRQGTDYALLFATNEYDHWNSLATPIADAEAIGAELENRYGFKVDIRKNVTIKEILIALAEYKVKRYAPGDQLFVYFAVHGAFDKGLDDGHVAGRKSELPTKDPHLSTYISYKKLRVALEDFPCERILLVLDVSYGGTFDDNIALDSPTKDNASTKKEVPANGSRQRLDLAETLKVKTRWYLSAGGNEAVSDGVDNSPFASALLQTLKGSNLADGVLTIPEIERQLPSALEVELDKLRGVYKGHKIEQTPSSGPFNKDKASDKAFVFIKSQK